jgi:glycosyltransferase involved in cell wall biosynthesis
MAQRPVRTLLFSTLYPSEVRPAHGIFVETRLRELLASGQVQTRVLAPVPWFPFKGRRFGEYGEFAATPHHESRHGIEVEHPRYLVLPKVWMNRAPDSLARASLPAIRALQAQGWDFDLIDAHCYYPDGVAAAMLARALGKPFIVTARGTDLNLVPDFPQPRRRILETADQAAASVGVCQALMDRLAELGADRAKLHVLRNGVDLQRFRPEPQAAAREHLGLAGGRWLVSVGHLVERKGHHLAIEALKALDADVQLAIVGRGTEEGALRALAGRLGLASRVRFAGQVAQTELRWWFSAAEATLLCSSREGWANVLLESMACGTPVVASRIWGTPEVVTGPDAGRLFEPRTAPALVQALSELLACPPQRARVRAHAENFSWAATTQGQLQLFERVLAAKPAAREPGR